jgi:hypothetical protein
MSKYAPLGKFLRQQRSELVAMKFEDIERVVGSKLPVNSQSYRAWWSNNPTNNVMTKVWLDAGFRTEQVDIEGRRLVFRRVRPRKEPETATSSPGSSEPARSGTRPRHPLFGALKGLLRVVPGTDLTKPADPSWGEG